MSPVLPVFIARQPIYDRMNQRVAYELLYRADQQAQASGGDIPGMGVPGDKALHALLAFGLDRITAGVTAFVNITREHLVGGFYKVLDPNAVMLELLETIEADPEVLQACEAARAAGYKLALDDFDGRTAVQPLLPYAELVKIDVLHDTPEQMAAKVRWLHRAGKQVLAERIETTAMLEACRKAGCILFQGYVFSRPETLNARTLTVEQVTMFNIVGMLKDPNVTDVQLENAFRINPKLSLQLIRFVNSAAVGARGVESIAHAIRIIGREPMSRWLLIMLVAQVAAQSPLAGENVTQALVRGRFCELLTGTRSDPATRFLLGMLSRMDVLMGLPMTEVLDRLPVSADMRNALLAAKGPLAPVLALAVAYEQGDWGRAAMLGHHPAELAQGYSEATTWATTQLAAGQASTSAG